MKYAKSGKNFGMKNLLLILDSNIYIFGFGLVRVPACQNLVLKISEESSLYGLRICRTIAREVRYHLSPEDFQKFFRFVNTLTDIDEDLLVPFEIVFKYETKGLKPADAFIAGYTEWTGADVLVTENRHFLTLRGDLPFKVVTAERCLRFIK